MSSLLKENIGGDLAAKADAELRKAFKKPIKGSGKDVSAQGALPYRKERMMGDSGAMFKREVPKDSVL